MSTSTKGILYLLPVPLGEDAWHTVPSYVQEQIFRLDTFVVERAKTARHFLKEAGYPRPIQEVTTLELTKDTPKNALAALLAPLLAGKNVGLMSEAGCPGVADPGAALIAEAHDQGIQVWPMVGPSSLLLALMGSGMNGQSFCFHGYLPAKKGQIGDALKKLEAQAKKLHQTQLFIEAPYRNHQIISEALKHLDSNTRFAIACDLTLPTEFMVSKSIKAWQQLPEIDLHKRPAVFLIGEV